MKSNRKNNNQKIINNNRRIIMKNYNNNKLIETDKSINCIIQTKFFVILYNTNKILFFSPATSLKEST